MLPLWLVVVILGIIEGLTEFLPISSTGHLIVADTFLGFKELLGTNGKEQADLFEVFIQLGAILAVGVVYREKLTGALTRSLTQAGEDRRLLLHLIVAFIPVAVVGFLFHKKIQALLFNPTTVAYSFIIGGILILIIERLPLAVRAESTGAMTLGQSFAVGCAQLLSLIPGMSRSACTIMGGMCSGMNRQTATEFSFLLSFPIMLAASGFSMMKKIKLLDASFLGYLALGFVVSFVVALVVIRWLIRYVQTHDFSPFAGYRILFGLLILLLAKNGLMS